MFPGAVGYRVSGAGSGFPVAGGGLLANFITNLVFFLVVLAKYLFWRGAWHWVMTVSGLGTFLIFPNFL